MRRVEEGNPALRTKIRGDTLVNMCGRGGGGSGSGQRRGLRQWQGKGQGKGQGGRRGRRGMYREQGGVGGQDLAELNLVKVSLDFFIQGMRREMHRLMHFVMHFNALCCTR